MNQILVDQQVRMRSAISRTLALVFLLILPFTACQSKTVQPNVISPPAENSISKKNVLVIYGLQSDLVSSRLSSDAIRERFSTTKDLQVELYFEYLDFGRFTNPLYQDQIIKLLNFKYSSKPIDLVIIANQVMIKWWPEYRAKILPDTPVVFFDVENDNLINQQLPPDFTGVSGEVDYVRSVEWYLGIRPAVNEIVIVHGMGPLDLNDFNYSPVQLLTDNFTDKVKITDISSLPYNEIKQQNLNPAAYICCDLSLTV